MNVARYPLVALSALTFVSSMAADLSTPENALKALEDAYIRKDLEAAVAAKDFRYEARARLAAFKKLPNPDEKLVDETADVLELSFRKEMKTRGFPDFKGLRCSVVKKTQLQPELIEMVEECVFSDREKSVNTLYAAKSDRGWRIVILPPKQSQRI